MWDDRLVVARGYDAITSEYLRLVRSMPREVRRKYLSVLARLVPPGRRLLELGCGAGEPMTQALVERYHVVALDISAGQLALASANVPPARLLRAEMSHPPFADAVFDAVAGFYSMTHVPRRDHRRLVAEIARVLAPGGLLVLTMGASDNPDGRADDWLGAPMFFSHFDSAANDRLVRDAGFEIISAVDEAEHEYGTPVTFHWVVARRGGHPR